MLTAARANELLETENGELYWKKCALYRWVPCRILAGTFNHDTELREVEIEGETYPVDYIIYELLTKEAT